MFKLEIKIDCRYQRDVFSLVVVTYVSFYTKLQI